MLLTAVLLYSNINVGYHCLSSLLVDACHGIHTIIITWFDYTLFTPVWEGCVACYHIIGKLILDNLSLISYTVKPLSTLAVCAVFLQVSFIHSFWSWKIAHMSNTSLYQMYCFSKCVFLMSCIHSGFLALTYSWKLHFQEKCSITNILFLEHTVVVTFPCQ